MNGAVMRITVTKIDDLPVKAGSPFPFSRIIASGFP
jgi:hypothetical protein